MASPLLPIHDFSNMLIKNLIPIGPKSGNSKCLLYISKTYPLAKDPSRIWTENWILTNQLKTPLTYPLGMITISPGAAWITPISVWNSSVPFCKTTKKSPSEFLNARRCIDVLHEYTWIARPVLVDGLPLPQTVANDSAKSIDVDVGEGKGDQRSWFGLASHSSDSVSGEETSNDLVIVGDGNGEKGVWQTAGRILYSQLQIEIYQ